MLRLIGILCFLSLIILGTSCGNIKNLQYLQGSFDTTRLSHYQIPEPTIQKGDILAIIVYSDNAKASLLYNQGAAITAISADAASPATGGGAQQGYLVNEKGVIFFQGLGPLQVEGLTKSQLGALLDSRLKDSLLTNPYYDIRFLNYKVTMLGDVNKPGIYNVPTERLSILQAIGLAGDLTIYGRRDNVQVIREENGKRDVARVNLNDPELLASPYFYLKQNDVVIVDPIKKKAALSDQSTVRNITVATSIVSAVGIIISVLRR